METQNRRPAWWQLYLLGLVVVGLLILGARAPLSELGHQVAAIGTLVLVYGLAELWLRANRAALLWSSKLILGERPYQKIVQQTTDEEHMPAYISWRLPLEADIVKGDNGDHGASRVADEGSATAGAEPRTTYRW